MKKTLLSLALAAAAMLPSVAQAQWSQLCWTATTKDVCTGWRVGTDAGKITLDVYTFGNLSPIRVTEVGVFGTGTTATLFSVTGTLVRTTDGGPVASGVNLLGDWSNGYGNNLTGNVANSFGAGAVQQDGVVGPLTSPSFGGAQTTEVDGSSFVRFAFTPAGSFDLSTASFGFFAQGDGVSLRCFTDRSINSTYDCGPPTRVPEPASFGLVFAGLAGLAGMTALRRRNQA